MGTPAFMAPEQALARMNDVDAQSDVWAAGATLFTLISGRFVHEAENGPQMLVQAATKPARSLATVATGVPAPVVEVVERALAFEKSARYPNATAMREALRQAHRAAFGSLPSRAELEALFEDLATASTHLPETSTDRRPTNESPQAAAVAQAVPEVASVGPARAPLVGATTSQPISSDANPIPLATPRRSRVPLVAGGAALVVALVGAGAYAGRTWSSGAAAPGTPASTSVITTAPPSPSSIVAETAAPSTTSPSTGVPSASVAPSAPIATHSTKPVASTPPRPSASASAAPKPSASSKPNCEPAYFFDQNGKHWKPECL